MTSELKGLSANNTQQDGGSDKDQEQKKRGVNAVQDAASSMKACDVLRKRALPK
jgi:hypothetical protein